MKQIMNNNSLSIANNKKYNTA